MKKYYLMAIELNHSSAMFNLAYYYQENEKDYDLMKKYYLMTIKQKHKKTIEICKSNNYFNDNEIKREILKLKFNIIEQKITCPISLEVTNECYVTKCNHEFSELIMECKTCPLCRSKF